MFDISFIELLVIFVVALLVLGPEKLPGAVRTGALWVGRAKRSFSKVKSEIELQLNTDDIRRQLHNESILADIEKARKGADNLLKDTQKELNRTQGEISSAITSAEPPAVPLVSSSAVEGVPTGADEWPDTTPDPVATKLPPSPAASSTTEDEAADQTDEDPTADEAEAEEPTVAAAKAPVQDFYNNPPAGLVTMKGGKMVATESVPPKDSSGQKD